MFMYILLIFILFFFFNDTATTEIYTLSLHDALPILVSERYLHSTQAAVLIQELVKEVLEPYLLIKHGTFTLKDSRSEEHTSELQSRQYLVCRLLLEKKKKRFTS